MRVWLAIVCFFKVLFDADFARSVRHLAEAPSAEPAAPAPAAAPPKRVAEKTQRSDAIALLATLQREARLVDIVCESLDAYSDAQIGAAARDVLRDSGKVLDRMFGLRPVVEAAEGSEIEVPSGYDPGRYRLTGNIAGEPPLAGQVMHAGWQATRCELPAWTGTPQAAMIIAAAEVQVK